MAPPEVRTCCVKRDGVFKHSLCESLCGECRPISLLPVIICSQGPTEINKVMQKHISTQLKCCCITNQSLSMPDVMYIYPSLH